MQVHIVREGECVSSISSDCGIPWQKIWNDPANASLRALRPNPNQLSPDDSLTLPELSPRIESAATGASHQYTVSGTLVMLRLRVLEAGTASWREREPVKSAPYSLTVGTLTVEGKTDGAGMVECAIPANATEGLLLIDRGTPKELRILLRLGHLGPTTEARGVQSRLANLGFYAGEINGIMGPDTLAALSAFASAVKLDPENPASPEVFDALRDAHDRQ